MRSPSGEVLDLGPGPITTFAEPFTKTDYRRYLEWSAPAEAGDYGVTITGVVPARFTVSVGTKEQFGTPVEDVPNRAEGVGGVLAWYRSPPPAGSPSTTATTLPEGADEAASSGGGGLGRVLIGVLGIAVVGAGVVVVVRRRRPEPGSTGVGR